ncbi:hypothetical protein Ae201684P_014827 [Aphanomyces euteiches]|uniref:RING-type domain-containing protein n=1 Tax=Aphanomyces euteiches TaxID=100861 RepID=A0A6G0WY26_9STRA|nr:hypothetical protein Ae201684_010470 [Aphanomyces euteiches]KAH9090072.1 hypothetical protein Ae201684P_014827 [Aphanomyces euteiches]
MTASTEEPFDRLGFCIDQSNSTIRHSDRPSTNQNRACIFGAMDFYVAFLRSITFPFLSAISNAGFSHGGSGGFPILPLRGLRPAAIQLARPPTPPAMVFVRFNEMASHEGMLNLMLHQALASVLEAENGLSSALHDLFMASLNLDPFNLPSASSSPRTSTAFLIKLEDKWWSQLPPDASCNTDCSICLSDFAPSDVVVNLPCHHTFHSECALPWLREHNVCPTCRFELPADKPDEVDSTRDAPEEPRAAEPVETLPGTPVDDDPQEALLEAEATALVADDDMEELVDEILDEMMEIEATSVVEQVQGQRRRSARDLDHFLDEAIAKDSVE